MKVSYPLVLLLLLHFKTSAQNLVANGGFEDENICTEYTKNCAPEAWIATSLYANYYFDTESKAYEGRHFIGLTAGSLKSNGVRNFVRTRLLCGLRKGKTYRLSIYVFSPHDVLDSIGIYFSADDFMFERRPFTEIQPQLWSWNAIDGRPSEHEKWQKIAWDYTASGDEGYMTVGNFKRVDYKGIRNGDYQYGYYFFIDQVSLTPIDEKEKPCVMIDSVRKEVYNENARHEMLRKWIYYYTKNPPKPIPLPVTRELVTRKIDTLIIPDIFFATASYELSPRSFGVLDSFANKLKGYQIDSVVIEGHTDSVGTLAYNEKLSANRAASVQSYLAAKVVDLDQRSVTRGFAFLHPATSNKTPAGRQKNRRVEIFVYRKE